jgi:hypothetical protein
MIQMPSVRTDTEFFAFEGGLDTESPALRIPAGAVISSVNYEPSASGGYTRVKGYERFSGQPAPSAATYTALRCTLTVTPASGALVTIGAATGLFVYAVTDGCILTNVTGTIPPSTSMTVGGSPVGTTGATITLGNVITAPIESQYLVDCADVRRALIASPAGSGAIRGLCYYGGALYAFRDNVGGTAGAMWKSTASGWAAVAFGEEVSFTNANTSVGDGDVLTQGGVTATISRVVVESGSLVSGTNTGRLIITGRSGGNLAAGAATSTGAGALTISGAQTAITLPAGGRYQFDVYNFYGQLTSIRMYGCNGVGRAFEFDGTVFVPLRTGAAVDTPSFIKAHRKYLYVGQGSSLMNGSVGNPYRWQASEGAVENAMGDTITGLVTLRGESLGILCRNSSFALVGSSQTDWVTQQIAPDVGAVPYTVVSMSDAYMLDDRGVTSIAAVQEYGNFGDSTLSKSIQRLIDSIRTKVVGAYVSRQKGMYTLLMNDGATLMMGTNMRKVVGFLEGKLPFVPSCVWSSEDETGVERIFMGTSTGAVYEMDKGSTFDGASIEALLKLYYYNSKSPRVRKRYRKLVIEMASTLYSLIRFRADFTYGDVNIEATSAQDFSMNGSGGNWGFANWDEFFWDAQDITQPQLPLDGTGLNIALSFYSNTKLDFGHTLQGAIMHYTARRQER